jgi:hypothetical protein
LEQATTGHNIIEGVSAAFALIEGRKPGKASGSKSTTER